ncbi:unnamed protein product, partial [Sphagnum compactum]
RQWRAAPDRLCSSAESGATGGISSSSGGNGSGGSSSNSSAAIHAIRLQFITIKYVSKLYMDRTAISNEEEASTLLLRAASSGSLLDLYTALLHGADVNSTTTVAEGLSTALHLSARGGHTLCVQLLCQWGARTTEVDVTGATALDLAGEKKYTDVLIDNIAKLATHRMII